MSTFNFGQFPGASKKEEESQPNPPLFSGYTPAGGQAQSNTSGFTFGTSPEFTGPTNPPPDSFGFAPPPVFEGYGAPRFSPGAPQPSQPTDFSGFSFGAGPCQVAPWAEEYESLSGSHAPQGSTSSKKRTAQGARPAEPSLSGALPADNPFAETIRMMQEKTAQEKQGTATSETAQESAAPAQAQDLPDYTSEGHSSPEPEQENMPPRTQPESSYPAGQRPLADFNFGSGGGVGTAPMFTANAGTVPPAVGGNHPPSFFSAAQPGLWSDPNYVKPEEQDTRSAQPTPPRPHAQATTDESAHLKALATDCVIEDIVNRINAQGKLLHLHAFSLEDLEAQFEELSVTQQEHNDTLDRHTTHVGKLFSLVSDLTEREQRITVVENSTANLSGRMTILEDDNQRLRNAAALHETWRLQVDQEKDRVVMALQDAERQGTEASHHASGVQKNLTGLSTSVDRRFEQNRGQMARLEASVEAWKKQDKSRLEAMVKKLLREHAENTAGPAVGSSTGACPTSAKNSKCTSPQAQADAFLDEVLSELRQPAKATSEPAPAKVQEAPTMADSSSGQPNPACDIASELDFFRQEWKAFQEEQATILEKYQKQQATDRALVQEQRAHIQLQACQIHDQQLQIEKQAEQIAEQQALLRQQSETCSRQELALDDLMRALKNSNGGAKTLAAGEKTGDHGESADNKEVRSLQDPIRATSCEGALSNSTAELVAALPVFAPAQAAPVVESPPSITKQKETASSQVTTTTSAPHSPLSVQLDLNTLLFNNLSTADTFKLLLLFLGLFLIMTMDTKTLLGAGGLAFGLWKYLEQTPAEAAEVSEESAEKLGAHGGRCANEGDEGAEVKAREGGNHMTDGK